MLDSPARSAGAVLPSHTLRTMATRGRPRLSSPERRRRILASKAKWRDDNREYYRAQKNRLSSRPEYLERRKELRVLAKARDTRSHTPTDAPERDTLCDASTAPVVAF